MAVLTGCQNFVKDLELSFMVEGLAVSGNADRLLIINDLELDPMVGG